MSAIETFVILMAQYMDIQRKAQAEVDQLTQRSRPPKSCDRANLPYLNAVLKEVLRTHPVGPLGTSTSAAAKTLLMPLHCLPASSPTPGPPGRLLQRLLDPCWIYCARKLMVWADSLN